MRDPFEGIGKPEPLRYALAGCWSRRLTQEHRLSTVLETTGLIFSRIRYSLLNGGSRSELPMRSWER